MSVSACVLLKSIRELIRQRERLLELSREAKAISSNIDSTVNVLAELAKEGSDRQAESLMAKAAPVMADAILESCEWLLTDFNNEDERKRCLDLLANALSEATGTKPGRKDEPEI